MGIALPEVNGRTFLTALVSMKETAVAVRDQTGDLTYRLVNDIQRSDVEMRVGIAGLQTDAAIIPSAVLTYLTDRGVDAVTLGELNTKVNTLNTTLTAWRGLALTTITGLSGADLVEVRQTTIQGEILREIVQKNAIPSASAASLRTSQELADVITALEDLGA